MATTLLRLGLWTVILVLVLYVLATTYPDEHWAELISMEMLQQALTLAGIVIATGISMRILGKGAQASPSRTAAGSAAGPSPPAPSTAANTSARSSPTRTRNPRTRIHA